MAVKVIDTRDNELDARIEASRLWDQGCRVSIMTTLEWNRYHPDNLCRTVNRFVIYEETRGGDNANSS